MEQLVQRHLYGTCVDFLGPPHDDLILKYPTVQRTSSLPRAGFGSNIASEGHGVSYVAAGGTTSLYHSDMFALLGGIF